jgi:hypothetical protein
MNTSAITALRTANPRLQAGFDGRVEAAGSVVRARVATTRLRSVKARRRLVPVSVAGVALAAVAATAAVMTLGTGKTENAAAAVEKAATVTAASAERSGTAVVRITHDGAFWAGTTVRWNGRDLVVAGDGPQRAGRAGSELRVVDGTMYGVEDGEWVVLGPPSSIDPGSGTTPNEYLAAVREDVGGATLRRIGDAMTGVTSRRLPDGSTVYSGRVPAGLIARETGFKEGQEIRVLPFGFVAHDQAEDPRALLEVAVTVGADGVVREIAVAWGTWRYTVAYSGLGTTREPAAPANPRPLRRTVR